LIGTGGWQYFNVKGDRLYEYSRAFDFVEVNSLFYRRAPLEQVTSWRKRVPENFVFTVKCCREVTHVQRLVNNHESMDALEYMLEVCRILRAPILIMETPPTLHITKELLRDFFSSISSREILFGLEIRGRTDEQALNIMREMGLIHVVDISRQEPGYCHKEITYTRLFGRGRHNIYQFDDQELNEISRKAENSPSKKFFLSFHTVKMYHDAGRLKRYRQTGEFPQATSKTGIESLEEILREDPRFPATKKELINRHGWKIIDLSGDTRVKAEQLLQKLDPTKTYLNIDQVITEMKQKVNYFSKIF